jgi:hypothetical protein
MRARAALAVSLAMAALALSAASSAAVPTFLAPKTLSKAGQHASAPNVAMAGAGNAVAVWRRFDGANQRVQASTRRAGGAWNRPATLSAAGRSARQPQVAIAARGNAVAVWRRHDGANNRIQAAVRPAGRAFRAPKTLSAAGRNASGARVAMDAAGNAIVAWERLDGANRRIQAAFRPAGGTFRAPQTLSAAGQSAFQPRVALDAAGNAIVAWRRNDGAADRIQAAFRPAGGTFGVPQTLSAAGEGLGAAPPATIPGAARDPDVAMDPAGNAVAVWRRFDGGDWRIQAAFRPAGVTFEAPQTLSATAWDAFRPRVAMDAAGNAIAVWRRGRIKAATRPAGGMFGVAQTLSAVGPVGDPHVAMDAAGNAVAAWRFGGVPSRFTPDKARIQVRTRPPGGAFGRPRALSAPGQDAGNPTVAMDAIGNALVGWQQSDRAKRRIQVAASTTRARP